MTNTELYNYLKANLLELYPCSSERLAFARRLFSCITGRGSQDMVLNPNLPVVMDDEEIASIISRVKRSEPLEYIFNKAQFLDFEFVTNGNVLIPRPETEELVLMVRDYVNRHGGSLQILDIGTGSGCIPISLSKYLPGSAFTAFDISGSALQTAIANANNHGCDIDFRKVDILEWDSQKHRVSCKKNNGKYDVIVSNPPYVMDSEKALMQKNVLDYEPHTALFVPDGDPLVFYREISRFAAQYLMEGGVLFFEINEQLGEETATLMEDCGFKNVEIIKDLFGKSRFAFGELISSN